MYIGSAELVLNEGDADFNHQFKLYVHICVHVRAHVRV